MSLDVSPTTSSIRPIVLAVGVDDLPARLDQEPGDRLAHTDRPSRYQTGPCVATGSVSERTRRMRSSPRISLLVDALEAAARHVRGSAVPEAARDTEAEARGFAVAGRVERRHQQRGAVEPVGGDELDLGIEVAPVRRQRGDRRVPGPGEGRPVRDRLRHGFARADELERARDSLLVEPREQPLDERGSGACSRPRRRRNAATVPRRPGFKRREQRSGPDGSRLVVDRQSQAGIRPVLRQPIDDLPPLVDEPHEPEHKLKLASWPRSRRRGLCREDLLREFFREMLLIRRFEEKVEERFRAGELPGFLHVAIGQEACAVGVCRALEEGDVIASTHRAHGHTLAKGTHPNEVMAELYGKLEGTSHGYGGSMHLYDVERGNLGANAVVGGGLPAITGAALAFKLRDEPRVAVAFFGDGATNIGTVHESLNLAQLWQVPAVFVCEDNHWAESTPASQHLPIEDLTKRAVAFGMEAMRADGQDVEEVYRASARRPRPCARGSRPGLPASRDLSAGRPLHRRPPGLPAEGRGRRAAQDAGSDHEAPRAPEAHRRGVRGRRPRGARARRGLGRVRKGRHRPETRRRLEEPLCLS